MAQPYYDPITQQYHDASGGTYSGSQYANMTPNRSPNPAQPPAPPPQQAQAPPDPGYTSAGGSGGFNETVPNASGISGVPGGTSNAQAASSNPYNGQQGYDQQRQMLVQHGYGQPGGVAQSAAAAPVASQSQAPMAHQQFGQRPMYGEQQHGAAAFGQGQQNQFGMGQMGMIPRGGGSPYGGGMGYGGAQQQPWWQQHGQQQQQGQQNWWNQAPRQPQQQPQTGQAAAPASQPPEQPQTAQGAPPRTNPLLQTRQRPA